MIACSILYINSKPVAMRASENNHNVASSKLLGSDVQYEDFMHHDIISL